MARRAKRKERCPMCCYSDNLPPLQMMPLRELVGITRALELTVSGHRLPTEDGLPYLGEPERNYPLSGLQSKLVNIHLAVKKVLEDLRSGKFGGDDLTTD